MSDRVIHVEELAREYQMGAERVQALRGLTLTSGATSTWRSWVRRAPASPRS